MQTKEQRHQSYLQNRIKILKNRAIYRNLHKEEINKKNLESYYRRKIKHILSNINRRCNNPTAKDWKWYGGRGIKNFLSEMDIEFLWNRDKAYLMKRANIDRINSNGNYELNNCQFIEQIDNINKSIKRKPILQYDLNGNFLKEYISIAEAGRILKVNSCCIVDCLKGNQKTCMSSTWKYKEII